MTKSREVVKREKTTSYMRVHNFMAVHLAQGMATVYHNFVLWQLLGIAAKLIAILVTLHVLQYSTLEKTIIGL